MIPSTILTTNKITTNGSLKQKRCPKAQVLLHKLRWGPIS